MIDACWMAISRCCDRELHDATCRNATDRALPSFVRWRKAGVWDRLRDTVTAAHHDDIQMIDPRPMPPAHFALLRPCYRIAPSSGSRFAEGARSPLRRCQFYPPSLFAKSSSIG